MDELTERYRKKEDDELFLKKFNSTLTDLENEYIASQKESDLPILFICGPPRSGTTLLTQVLAQSGLFTYADNFIARFWRIPYIGLYLEKLIGLREKLGHTGYTFQSDLGRTAGILDPHEFTYFWRHWLKHDGEIDVIPLSKLSDIDTEGLRKEINAMVSIYHKPVFFKTYITLINPLILHNIFHNAHFIIFKRDLLANALSIFSAREEYFGNVDTWWSIKPSNYHTIKVLSVEKQIIGQLTGIYSDIDGQIKDFPERTMEISYEKLAQDPLEMLERISSFLNMKEFDRTTIKKTIPEKFKLDIETDKFPSEQIERFERVIAHFSK
jgi:LPS sulfotransferase NodH